MSAVFCLHPECVLRGLFRACRFRCVSVGLRTCERHLFGFALDLRSRCRLRYGIFVSGGALPCGDFCNLLGVSSGDCFVPGASVCLRAPRHFRRERSIGLGPLICEDRKLALGLRARFLSASFLRFSVLAAPQCFERPCFVLCAFARGLLGSAFSFGACVRHVRGLHFCGDSLACGRVRLLLGLEACLSDSLCFALFLSERLRLRERLQIEGFTCLRGFVRARLRFGAFGRCEVSCLIGLQTRGRALLQLGFGPLARTRSVRRFLFGGGARSRSFSCRELRRRACLRNRLGGKLRFGACGGLSLEFAFGLRSIAFGFQGFLIGRGACFGRFRCARFDRRTRFGGRLGRTLCLPARDRVLLCFILECEARVCGFDRLLIGGGTGMRGVVRFELRLLTRLRFLYCPRVRRDATLRAHLGLPFHFRALERDPGGGSIRFGPSRGLRRTGRFGRFACPGGHERTALGVCGRVALRFLVRRS
jgi:hypothetical protein